MAKPRMGAGLLMGCLVCWSGVATAWSATTPEKMLEWHPKQEGITYSTPAKEEIHSCQVEALQGNSGWLLRDGQGVPLRRFYDTNGDNKIDTWAYYANGVEVYRDMDSRYTGHIDSYRWLNTAGTRWGRDLNNDGKIDTWIVISPEEVSQEVLQAVITKDFARLQALWISEAEMKALQMSASEITRILDVQKKAAERFQSTVAKLNLDARAHWIRVETPLPQCLPAETTGMKRDLVKYPSAMLLYEAGTKQDLLQLGELIQVGAAWKLIDAPVPGLGVGTVAESDDPALIKLTDELRLLDQDAPRPDGAAGPNAKVVQYNVQRAELIGKILVLNKKPDERERWIRQQADCLSAAAQSSPKEDRAAYQQLVQLAGQIVNSFPATGLAAYVTFREMTADYAAKLNSTPGAEFGKLQEQWVERLKKFVQLYAHAEDTPDVLLQLGMVSEFMGKETEAKNWYEQLVNGFGTHPLAAKAKGALLRMELEGKPLQLASPKLDGGDFDLAQVHGKVVIVYYWASWNQQCLGDFAKIKLLLNTYGSKGLELVCVNLDNSASDAKDFLQKAPAPGVQLFQSGGLESPLAKQYGIMVLPNLFLVGRDGKVVSRTVQMNSLEEEIKKQIK